MRKTTIKTKMSSISSITIEEAESKFKKHNVTKNLSKATMDNYDYSIKLLYNVVPKETAISKINIETIEDLIMSLKERGVSITSINTCIRTVRVFLYFCMERDYLDEFKIRLLKAEEKMKEPYTEEELKKLLKKPRSEQWTEWRNWAISNYFLATGNRINTVINLKIEDLDFRHSTIALNTTKNKKQQIVPMAESLSKVLKHYLSLWEYEPTDYLFPSCEGKQLTTDGLVGIIRKYNISRGVTKTSCHLYRHTFAKMYIMNGGGMLQLQKLLGHSTLDMTKKYVNLYGTDLQVNYEQYNPLDNLN